MSDLDHARELVEMARGDLNALKGMLQLDEAVGKLYFSDEVFGFHAQQAAEKCLKAAIASLGGSYPKSHDLMSLVDKLEDLGENVTDFSNIIDLNPFAVQYRYESLDSDDEELDRIALLNEIQILFDRIEGMLLKNG
jgi:predicted flavoprotein YhiN